jgi:hypothetical protein
MSGSNAPYAVSTLPNTGFLRLPQVLAVFL